MLLGLVSFVIFQACFLGDLKSIAIVQYIIVIICNKM